jgi:flagellar L-ring protein precursor FlgH
MFQIFRAFLVFSILAGTGCGRLANVGKVPELSEVQSSNEFQAMMSPGFPQTTERGRQVDDASLWSRGRSSLLGDRRALERGDILTVVIEIDDKAEISNTSSRSRSGSEKMGIPQFFGIPQRIDQRLPEGATMGTAVEANSSGTFSGTGSVKRNEKLTLRIAATVTGVMQNGALAIEGRQEVRVNFEIRELTITGFVRPKDISRQNEITYDKIASARISYGGRGQISDVQQPRIGQQITDIILPF